MDLDNGLAGLRDVAANLWAGWDPSAQRLFEALDARLWEEVHHNPVALLERINHRELDAKLRAGDLISWIHKVTRALDVYENTPNERSDLGLVAYFSPEFGLESYLPTYSGGLGVLAGDHLKAASDAGVPLVGVGLLYKQGYFTQEVDAQGRQHESYPSVDLVELPLSRVETEGRPLSVNLDLAGTPCAVAVWRVRVGRVDLLLLDTDLAENAAGQKAVTDRLYSGDSEHRLSQEIVLGIGGIRALRAAGYEPTVFHSNEGHAGFLGLERIRELLTAGMSKEDAVETVRKTTVFTTHTPLQVAIDVFDRSLLERYFAGFATDFDGGVDELMAFGAAATNPGAFNMAALGINMSEHINGVSRLHGDVSRGLFAHMWPGLDSESIPIGSVTNGVHAGTWLGPAMHDLQDRYSSESGGDDWRWVAAVSDEELWSARNAARRRLVDYVRGKVRSGDETPPPWVEDLLDPDVLTISFARRFAQYKRATLMMSEPERLRRLLLSDDRPVQVIVAGKAHPHDEGGKDLIAQLIRFARDPAVRSRFVFVENYDIEVGRMLAQGSDVWLNNPRRPLEACGTSGMKAAMNGGLNCSVLDGWWDECFDGHNGWAIGDREVLDDPAEQDRRDAESEYRVLEEHVVPLFYERNSDGLPVDWLHTVRRSMETLAARVDAGRMMRDYLQGLYEPAARAGNPEIV
ncbi:MAG: alpha-glucan family phosphorylase [Actinomycetota bacterium]|nr:alpha-glucan family phosphorylase [Actinomycetota bacterium]